MAYNKKYKTSERDYKQELSDKVAAQIESLIEDIENPGSKSWHKPWFSCSEAPHNPFTGTKYSGVNFVSLVTAGYDDARWGTFNNWAGMEKQRLDAHAEVDPVLKEEKFQVLEKLGMVDRDKPIHVRKGETGTPVFKAVQVAARGSGDQELDGGEPGEESGPPGDKKMIWVSAFAANSFNASQIENIRPAVVREMTFEPHQEANLLLQAMVEKTGLKVEHNDGGRAFYRPSNHSVTMPRAERFESMNAYYDTLLHEFGHSTGKELKREMGGAFGSSLYAKEELVAEITSVMMSAELGIPHDSNSHENSVGYLKGWLTAIKGDDKNKPDKNLLFKAASHASRAVEYQTKILAEYKAELTQKHVAKIDVTPKIEPQIPRLQVKQVQTLSM
jgi:antirestriction protein ArdC